MSELHLHAGGGRQRALLDPKACNHARSLADVPLDWVQAEGAIRQMSDSYVLARRKQIDRLARNERRHGNLEWPRHPHSAALVCPTRVYIDHIEPDSNGVIKQAGSRTRLRVRNDVLFGYTTSRDDAPGLPNVWVLGHAIGSIHEVGPEAQLRVPLLKPMEKGLRGFLGAL